MSANGNGHSWSKFWWRDWQSDAELRTCSLAARGLWIEILALCHASDRTGYLLVKGVPPTPVVLARLLGNTHWREVSRLLAELKRAHVASTDDAGVIYSRRMVNDAKAAVTGRAAAEKRWNNNGIERHKAPEPNGLPNGMANGEAKGQPNAKNLEEERLKTLREGKVAPREEPPPKAPVLNATTGGGSTYRKPGASDDPADQPVDPQKLADLANRVARGFQNNYPPRAAILDANQQRDVIEAASRRPSAKSLPTEHLAAIRRAAGYGWPQHQHATGD